MDRNFIFVPIHFKKTGAATIYIKAELMNEIQKELKLENREPVKISWEFETKSIRIEKII